MKYNLLSLAALLAATTSGAVAEDQKKSTVVSLPPFQPFSLKSSAFLEQFSKPSLGRWEVSTAERKENGKESGAYDGSWIVQEPSAQPFQAGDFGLVLSDSGTNYAIASAFDKPLVPGVDKPLVVQYEVKLQDGLECGGAYIKLVSQSEDGKPFDPKSFNNETPYTVMFGPDRCGVKNLVHFILRHKNPKTGEVTEHSPKNPPMAKVNKKSALYTLIVNPDNSFEIRIDNKAVYSGNLLTDMEVPINPPKEISDPDDHMPEDWVHEAEIPDPKATKPEDWDEDAPKRIVDEKAVKPADWLDNEPLEIPDPEDKAPEEWNSDEDGDYISRTIPNPKCEQVSGCGKWEPPMIDNPAYKGKWVPPMIPNPAYKGVWTARKIPNPNYFEDQHPAAMTPIVGAGFELHTIQKNILFDNIYVGESVKEAEELAQHTWQLKFDAEQAKDKETKPKDGKDEVIPDPKDIVNFIRYQVDKFVRDATVLVEAARKDVGQAIVDQPRVAGIIGLLFVTVAWFLNLVLAAFMPKATTPATKGKQQVKPVDKANDDTAAKTTAVVDKEGATRRSTRNKAATEGTEE